MLREYVWLDSQPLAVINANGGSPATYFIHTGPQNEPLAMTDGSKAKVWDAYMEPFGLAGMFGAPTQNLDLRLPGQWEQAETGGLYQNGFRDCDPTLGRYIEVDPLGIGAGLNL